jgi:hypothetical protein
MEKLKELFEGQDLSNELKDKLSEIMEAAVAAQVAEETEVLQAKFDAKLAEAIAEKTEELEGQVETYIQENVVGEIDKYLTMATNEWLTENKVAIADNAKVKLAESFMTGMVGLAKEYAVDVPEGAFTQIAEMEAKVSKLEESLLAAKQANAELVEAATLATKESIVLSAAKDLTESQKEKFSPAAMKIEYRSQEQYSEAVKNLFESYFPVNEDTKVELDNEKVQVVETEQNTYLNGLAALLG